MIKLAMVFGVLWAVFAVYIAVRTLARLISGNLPRDWSVLETVSLAIFTILFWWVMIWHDNTRSILVSVIV